MVEDIVYVIREVVEWIKGRQPSGEAVTAFLQAVYATEAYLADKDKFGEDRYREAELVSLWTECAVLLRPSNPELANRLKNKARSWAVPTEYQDSDLNQLGIDISRIKEEADELFKGR